ncbi:MAG: KH domain-containing protein [Eggerthellaceae bacterium]|nr:KH domain-containing protein [Eggerthellaceae bacterium]
MDEQMADIVGLVKTIVEPLIEFPDDLEIVSSESSDGSILVEISLNEEDVGKVIGRQGRVIKAIRTLARAVTSQTNTHVEVELID